VLQGKKQRKRERNRGRGGKQRKRKKQRKRREAGLQRRPERRQGAYEADGYTIDGGGRASVDGQELQVQ